jgi:thioredoxin 1
MQAITTTTPPALVHLTAPELPAALAARGVTLLDFTAPWCAPCHALAPILGELTATYAGRARIAAIDVQDHPTVAQAFRVTSMPTLVLVRDGREVGRIVGLRARKVIVGALDRALAGDVAITGA